jgi:AcrR family transcriptional regulator
MKAKTKRVPGTERRQQILAVATKLFAQQGFNATTTKQIAAKARINETILFRHFPHKQDLYWAVIEEKCRGTPARQSLAEQLAAGGDEQALFTAVGTEILERNTHDTTLTRLLLFTALEEHELSGRFFKTYATGYYELLANYIRQRVKAGAFRPVNPLLAARSFLGMLVYHIWVQELFGAGRYQKFAIAEVSETIAGIWLEGMKAQ